MFLKKVLKYQKCSKRDTSRYSTNVRPPVYSKSTVNMWKRALPIPGICTKNGGTECRKCDKNRGKTHKATDRCSNYENINITRHEITHTSCPITTKIIQLE